MRDAGLPVHLDVRGSPRSLPAGVELAAYRVVQEALTNALKHARPARVDVALDFSDAALRISVANDGARAGGHSAGHGLIGMRERVSLYGGRLAAGERPGGRFEIAAEIPLEPAPA
jgi:signal transduction histidine kinase